eukprot:scaffold214302_cov17-Tisochrysis_lutea.AAC.1
MAHSKHYHGVCTTESPVLVQLNSKMTPCVQAFAPVLSVTMMSCNVLVKACQMNALKAAMACRVNASKAVMLNTVWIHAAKAAIVRRKSTFAREVLHSQPVQRHFLQFEFAHLFQRHVPLRLVLPPGAPQAATGPGHLSHFSRQIMCASHLQTRAPHELLLQAACVASRHGRGCCSVRGGGACVNLILVIILASIIECLYACWMIRWQLQRANLRHSAEFCEQQCWGLVTPRRFFNKVKGNLTESAVVGKGLQHTHRPDQPGCWAACLLTIPHNPSESPAAGRLSAERRRICMREAWQ